jgi:hypothetical protein
MMLVHTPFRKSCGQKGREGGLITARPIQITWAVKCRAQRIRSGDIVETTQNKTVQLTSTKNILMSAQQFNIVYWDCDSKHCGIPT